MPKSAVAFFLFLFSLTNCSLSNGANILAIFPSPSPSHLVIDMAVVNALADRQHNVTVLTVLPLESSLKHPNVTHIQLKYGLTDMTSTIKSTQNANGPLALVSILKAFRSLTLNCADVMKDPELHSILRNGDNKFDLFIMGYIFSDYLFGVAAHFKCPIALIWPNQPMPFLLKLIGNPLESSYIPIAFLTTGDVINFKFRFINFINTLLEEVVMTSLNIFMKSIYDEHFPADKYPSYREVQQKVSLMLYANHFTEKPVRALVPGLIEIGGIQLNDKPKKLPKDIETFLDSATDHGAIFFSLGTNVRREYLESDTLQKIFNVLSKLPQKIIWICDAPDIPGNSSNILFQNWVPQSDILAHPNIRIFFNHGGKGGITEAIFNGVPMIGLPIFGDQHRNLEVMTNQGYGVTITDFRSMTEDDIKRAIKEVLENPSYRTEIQRFSKLYRDRPMSAKETAVYWLEYIIRHKGAPHMQSPLTSLNLLEAYNIDIMIIFTIIIIVLVKIVKFVVHIVRKYLTKIKKTKLN